MITHGQKTSRLQIYTEVYEKLVSHQSTNNNVPFRERYFGGSFGRLGLSDTALTG